MRRSAEQRFRPMKDYAAPPKVKWGSFFSVIQFFMGGLVAFYTGFELAILFSAGVPIVLTNLSSFLVGKMQGGLLSVPLLLSLTLIVLILSISVYFVQFEAMVRSANYRLLRQTQLREALLDRSIEQKRAYHRSFSQGKLLSTINGTTGDLLFNFLEMSSWNVRGLVIFLGCCGVLFATFGPIVLLFTVFMQFLGAVLGYTIAVHIEPLYDKGVEERDHLSETMREYVEGMREVRGYDLLALARKKNRENMHKLLRVNTQVTFWEFIQTDLIFAIVVCMTVGNLLLIKSLGLQDLKASSLFLLVMLCGYMESPIWSMSYLMLSYRTARVNSRRVAKLYEKEDGIVYGEEELSHFEEAIFSHYSYQFEDGAIGLEDVSGAIHKGEWIAVVGETGAGKSILLEQFFRYDPAGKGELLINGKPIQSYSAHAFDGKFAYVGQDVLLLSDTIANNLRLYKEDATEAEMLHALAIAAFDFEANMPDGLETLVGQRGVTLSGGQKKRLALAQVLLSEAEFLVLDDVLSAVDVMTEQRILGALEKRRQERPQTVLISTHRLNITKNCDRIWVMDRAGLVEEGSYEQLIHSSAVFQRLAQEMQEEVSDEEDL